MNPAVIFFSSLATPWVYLGRKVGLIEENPEIPAWKWASARYSSSEEVCEAVGEAVGEMIETHPPPRHYIFGFGSLISPESRARTGDSGAAHVATISGCERSWSLRVSLPPAACVNPAIRGVSAVSIRLLSPPPSNSSSSSSPSSPPPTCAGVLAEVAEAQLPNFDAREIGYKRVSIHLSRVTLHGNSNTTTTTTTTTTNNNNNN